MVKMETEELVVDILRYAFEKYNFRYEDLIKYLIEERKHDKELVNKSTRDYLHTFCKYWEGSSPEAYEFISQNYIYIIQVEQLIKTRQLAKSAQEQAKNADKYAIAALFVSMGIGIVSIIFSVVQFFSSVQLSDSTIAKIYSLKDSSLSSKLDRLIVLQEKQLAIDSVQMNSKKALPAHRISRQDQRLPNQ